MTSDGGIDFSGVDWPLVWLLALSAIVMGWGIWRVEPHLMLGDETSAVSRSLRLLFVDPLTTTFRKGGNAHLRILGVGYLPLGLWWMATGQLAAALAGINALSAGVDWGDESFLSLYYQAAVAARIVSVIAGVATVYLLYRLSEELSNRRSGLLAAGLLTVTMGFVSTAKYATEDVLQAAVVLWVLYLLTRAVNTRSSSHLYMAAIAFGVACSVKATSGLLLLPFLAAIGFIYRQSPVRRGIPSTATYVGLGAVIYFVTTPSAVAFPLTWGERMVLYLFSVSGGAPYPFQYPKWQIAISHLAQAQGIALLSLSAVSTIAVSYWLWHRCVDRRLILVFLFGAPYALLFATGTMPQFFRAMVLLPLLALVSGFSLDALLSSDRIAVRRAVVGVTVVVLVFSSVYAGSAVIGWSQSRTEATEWASTLDQGTTVDTIAHRLYLPEFPDDVEVRRHRSKIVGNATARQRAVDTIREGCSDFIVLSSYHYHRFYRSPGTYPSVHRLVSDLMTGVSFEVVERFGPPPTTDYSPTWKLRQSWTLNHYSKSDGNPTILVIHRRATSPGCSG